MKRYLLIVLLGLFFYNSSFSQSGYSTWDKNYSEINLIELLNYEKHYADSIEKDKTIPPYYYSTGKYRFKAIYLGEIRKLDSAIRQSMMNVYSMQIGDVANLNKLLDKEVLFEVDGQKIWMPIQIQLEDDLHAEMTKGDVATLYCLHFNEHKFNNTLYNIFLISEFIKEE
jgi:hypothetical protein